ncbi:MAG: OstA-like protein [Bacillota bacterium]
MNIGTVLLIITILLFGGWLAPVAAIPLIKIEADGGVDFDNNKNITYAIKNVRMAGDDFLLIAEQLTFNATNGRVEAWGGISFSFQQDQVTIVADGINYDTINNIVDAFGGVKLKFKKELQIDADQLTYNGNTGEVTTYGVSGVRVSLKQKVYYAETIQYNIKNGSGYFGSIDSSVEIGGNIYSLNGDDAEEENSVSSIENIKITRCPKPKPDYIVTGKRATFDGKRIVMSQVLLVVKGIPIFYFPVISFDVGRNELPDSEETRSDDGLSIEYKTPVQAKEGWIYQTELETRGLYAIGAGVSVYRGNLKNFFGVLYNLEGTWGIEDKMTFDIPSLRVTLEGYREFLSNLPTQYQLTITRKYWKGPGGEWQFGVLESIVSAYDEQGQYGGTYGGARLDYKPVSNVTLSVLQIENITGGDYRELMSDFKTGTNWLYGVKIPLNTLYSFSADGTYNTDKSWWTHRIYRFTRETCCFRFSAGWDDAINKWVFGLALKI